ncbi:MAG: ATP-grasp domain-containing protein [Hyphomicrobiaceae bacterium]
MESDRRTPQNTPIRVAVFVEENGGDWHTSRLVEALESLGASVVIATLSQCAFDSASKTGLDIPGFADALPDGVFVRSVSKGSLEQITLRLGILHALSASGVRVWNPARVIERCVDKSTATFLFQRANLPTPQTRTAEGQTAAIAYAQKKMPLVSKPLFGSQGRGVTRITKTPDLPAPEELGNVYYLQRYIPPAPDQGFADWRVLVSANHAIASMKRLGRDWVTNVFQGSSPEPWQDTEMAKLAIRAAKAVGADYAGVDLIRNGDGQLLVLEINSNPAWKGLQSVTDQNIAACLAVDFLTAVQRHIKITQHQPT